ncbi:MAG: GGDEF domain-containing protein [Erysipelotrichaceae bacterium]
MKDIKNLQDIIQKKAIYTVFQPIISLRDGSILGHEALTRIDHSASHRNIEQWFQLANECGILWELEKCCRSKTFETAYEILKPPYQKLLFINVNPNLIHDQNFMQGMTREYLEKFNIQPENIVFEITERNSVNDLQGFMSMLEHYRKQNYQIAMDDVGSGYSGLNLICDVHPNFIKLDMKLIRDIHEDALKYALVKGMVALSQTSNIKIIAEGIECKAELLTLMQLGVQYGQGYFIQRPEKEIYEISDDLIQTIQNFHQLQHLASNNSHTIGSIVRSNNTCQPTTPVLHLHEESLHNPDYIGTTIVEDGKPLGIITREKLSQKLSGRYGYSLFQNKQANHLMSFQALIVQSHIPIRDVAKEAMQRNRDQLYDYIVITNQEQQYMGIVTVKDLLEKTMELEVQTAKHQNPLTGLPGNLWIEEAIKQHITQQESFVIAYLDIDHFKPYNDIYGFESGDYIIRLVASLCIQILPKDAFIGHIGGDDFVIISKHPLALAHLEQIKVKFAEDVKTYYRNDHLESGYVTSNNRQGEMQSFPLCTLTIASLEHSGEPYSVDDISQALAIRKQEAKKQVHKHCKRPA